MKISFKKEWPLLLVAAIPFIYLAYLWNALPDKVPLHWNVQGEIDRWGDKSQLWMIPVMTTGLIYLILLFVPAIDPKGRIGKMGVKYTQLRYILVGCMAALAVIIIHMVRGAESTSLTPILAIIGLLFALLGNYFKTVQPNYFIGIRTPWTLENPEVWKKTHRVSGWLWFGGGLVMILLAFLLEGKLQMVLFLSVTAILAVVPLLYSYLLFRATRDPGTTRP